MREAVTVRMRTQDPVAIQQSLVIYVDTQFVLLSQDV
jgi:hypothetical protein